MAFEPTAQVEGHDSYNTAIRVTPERAWAVPA